MQLFYEVQSQQKVLHILSTSYFTLKLQRNSKEIDMCLDEICYCVNVIAYILRMNQPSNLAILWKWTVHEPTFYRSQRFPTHTPVYQFAQPNEDLHQLHLGFPPHCDSQQRWPFTCKSPCLVWTPQLDCLAAYLLWEVMLTLMPLRAARLAAYKWHQIQSMGLFLVHHMNTKDWIARWTPCLLICPFGCHQPQICYLRTPRVLRWFQPASRATLILLVILLLEDYLFKYEYMG